MRNLPARFFLSLLNLAAVLGIFSAVLFGSSAGAQVQSVPLLVPPEPVVKPVIPVLFETDLNNNLIEDTIDTNLTAAQAIIANLSAKPADKTIAQAILDEVIIVKLNFDRQITLAELSLPNSRPAAFTNSVII
jgi:hypothetical protein